MQALKGGSPVKEAIMTRRWRLLVLTVLVSADLKPDKWLPPSWVLILFANEKRFSA
jgi:hypothetical protein